MKQHFHNALTVARYLESDPRVEKVIFPGLPSHPQYELMKRQCTGCPGMISFYIKGNFEHASKFLKNLKLFALAESLGGYESLAEHPAIMTHASVPKADREALGISDMFIRLSIGLEDSEDLLEDLDQALKAAHSLMQTAHCLLEQLQLKVASRVAQNELSAQHQDIKAEGVDGKGPME
ncbi:cystathionine gamma-lyase isoform X2 [Rhineura floridana]|uniref:cystathionine gamma-lyase isoform X2 n=1 Tax=Rhineura floridana TaxID=261503 RepID=UPI002AC82D5D|nr:cystathionine gamma-lyase isoform X2 [Rhineura floridana]